MGLPELCLVLRRSGAIISCYKAPHAKEKTHLSEAERAKRIRETAKAIGTSDDPKDFERAFKRVVPATSKRET